MNKKSSVFWKLWSAAALCSAFLAVSVIANPVLPPAGADRVVPDEQQPKFAAEPFTWVQLPLDLPPSIRVFEAGGVNADGQMLHALYADIDYSDPSVQVKAAVSDAPIGRETMSSFARKVKGLVTINGGYFEMRGQGTTYNTVISDGKVLAENPALSLRAVFGVRAKREPVDQLFDLKWIAHRNGKPMAFPNPEEKSLETARVWDVKEAIGGGPALIVDGEINIRAAAESFGKSHVTARHPRTAVGSYVKDGRPHLVFFVVDGRQPNHSMGMSLQELAQTLKEIGCTQALNLDGGGSSTFAVRDQVYNMPSDGKQRSISSVFSIVAVPAAE